jgi:hypothetical protein
MSKLTPQSLREMVGPTHFDIYEEGEDIILESRDHGDTFFEKPGAEDIEEGKRLLRSVKAHLAMESEVMKERTMSIEAIEEWVRVTIGASRQP